ncbi:MAG: hypothetical protein ACJAT2_000325 [Bacteriovoracaceae bacterium]|jgi:hypothetical protein
MNAKLVIIALAGLTLGTSAMAAGKSLMNFEDARKMLRRSPLGLSLLHAVDAKKKAGSNKTVGSAQTHIAYLKYQLTPNDRLQLETRYTANKTADMKEADHSFARSVIKYTRSGILNQAEHGINLSMNLEKRFYPDKDIRNSTNQYGLNRLSASMSRSFGAVNLSGTFYGAVRDRIDTSDHSTSTHYGYAVLRQSYSINDSWSVTLTEELFQSYNKNQDNLRGGQGNVDMTLGLGNQLSPSVYAEVSVGGAPFQAYDGKLIASNWTQGFNYGAYVYWSAF